ncbi:Uncharacterized protein SCP_1700510 [Sparassis crispa]|uniref:Solute carrier family 35 member F6 n=1 Tax=Sparassis crispa TaxID=139825 RepID=A0A401H5K8_9APHY|nr:Uncharacterized protein SCP_1700510 [Sparassis crispa]GBE89727.1 Uncharacterized protein SCP_1700510 [Sparassis crispa]
MPSFYVPALIAGMLITGSSNSLWTKWQDMQCVEDCNDPNPAHHVLYEQPVWQTLQMFLGEMLCFLPVVYAWLATRRSPTPLQLPTDAEEEPAEGSKMQIAGKPMRGWSILLFWFPAACDLTGTTLMNVGLLYTPVSIYQMTRGALVLFVGVLSVIFLRRRLWLYQWISLITVMGGVSLVGYSGSLIKEAVKETDLLDDAPSGKPEVTQVLVGVFFILFAQIFAATQFVVEEKIMSHYSVGSFMAVGYEGFFGALSIVLAMPILARFASVSPFFDLPRGWHQMVDTPTVLGSAFIIALSISLFNFCGLSVTRHVSATARSLTDTCRTLSIWLISLALGWEAIVWPISMLQVLGFSLLVYGTFLFNNLVTPPAFLRRPSEATPTLLAEDAGEEAALLTEETLDETAALPVDLGRSGYDAVPPHAHARRTSSPHTARRVD